MWFKLVERLMFFCLLQLIIPGLHLGLRSLTLLSMIVSLFFEISRSKSQTDEKRLLQELNKLLSLIESGNSPRYSYEQLNFIDYPDYLTHPLDDYFNPAIFKRQVGLFEKNILIHSELEAEFAIVGYRMTLMKFIPLLIMIGLQRMINLDTPSLIHYLIIIGFIGTYYLADRLVQT